MTNADHFDFATFGISIVGGDLNDASGFRKEYLNGDPQKAGYVVYSNKGMIKNSSDLTLPIAWAMGLELDTKDQRFST